MARHPDLHPLLATVLDREAALPPLRTLTPPEARMTLRRRMDPLLTSFQPRCARQDLSIDGPGGPLALRLLKPITTNADPLPLILFLHGGGWVLCDLDMYMPLADALATASGVAVLMVDYRLAPEHRFPAALEDSLAALEWLWSHGLDHGLDPARIALAGDSAGGNLAAVLARGCRDQGGPPLRAQYLLYPVVDLPDPTRYPTYSEMGDDYGLSQTDMAYYWSLYAGNAAPGPDLMPMMAELAGLPPALIHTAQFDVLRSEGEAYAAALDDAGVQVSLKCWPGMIHGFASLAGVLGPADASLEEAGAWLSQHLRPGDPRAE